MINAQVVINKMKSKFVSICQIVVCTLKKTCLFELRKLHDLYMNITDEEAIILNIVSVSTLGLPLKEVNTKRKS